MYDKKLSFTTYLCKLLSYYTYLTDIARINIQIGSVYPVTFRRSREPIPLRSYSVTQDIRKGSQTSGLFDTMLDTYTKNYICVFYFVHISILLCTFNSLHIYVCVRIRHVLKTHTHTHCGIDVSGDNVNSLYTYIIYIMCRFITRSSGSNGVRPARAMLCVYYVYTDILYTYIYIPTCVWTWLNKMFTHVMCVSKCHETRDFTLGRHARAQWRRVLLKTIVPIL